MELDPQRLVFDPKSNSNPTDSQEFEKGMKNPSETPVFTSSSEISVEDDQGSRAKSSLRMRYEAEVGLIKRKIGDLESIRGMLGLTQRKMCQLLLVDPSAWTRWTRDGEDAPPHMYRMLQWYLALNEKYPVLDVNFWLSTVTPIREPHELALRDQRISELGSELAQLQKELDRLSVDAWSASQRAFETEKMMVSHRLEAVNAANKLRAHQRTMVILASVASFIGGIAIALLSAS